MGGLDHLLTEDVDHSLGIGIAVIGGVWRAVVYHGLVNRVVRFVGEDAR